MCYKHLFVDILSWCCSQIRRLNLKYVCDLDLLLLNLFSIIKYILAFGKIAVGLVMGRLENK